MPRHVLTELEQEFERLADRIPDSPIKDAISVPHGIVMEVWRMDQPAVSTPLVDIDRDPFARSRLAWVTGGRVRSPTVVVDGEVLVQPTNEELEWTLRRSGLARTA
jgi:hypothetical protein